MRVTIDPDRCNGNAVCVSVAPEVFDIGDDGKAYVLVDSVASEDRDLMNQAVSMCPTQAIALTFED